MLAATPVIALALVAAGCGSSSPTAATSTTTATTTNANGSAATAAFRACLAKAGVKLPAGFGSGRPPQGGGAGQPPPTTGTGQPPQGGSLPSFSAKQRAALAACQSTLPAGARGGGFRGGGQNNPALAKYTSCLRKHGVTFGATNNQAAFKKASAACAKYAPNPGG